MNSHNPSAHHVTVGPSPQRAAGVWTRRVPHDIQTGQRRLNRQSLGVPWRILVARIHARLHKRVSRHPVASWVFQDEQGMGSDILNLRVLLAHHGRTPLASEYISLQDLRPIHKSLKHPGTSETVAAEVEECGKQYIEPPKHHGAIWKSTRIDSNPTRKSESLESPGRSGTAAAAVSRERPADQVNFQVMPLEALKDRRLRYVIEDRQ